MKANYQLVFNRRNKINSKGEAPIEIRIIKDGKKIYHSTKIYIKPYQWNVSRLRINSKHPNNIKINNYLYNKLAELEEYELSEENKRQSELSIEDLKIYLKSGINKNKNFPVWCKKIVENDETVTISTNKKRQVLVNRLFRFNKELMFNQLDYTFMREFDNFLHKEKTFDGQPLKQVTIHGQIKILRYFLNLAHKEQKISYVPKYTVKRGEIPKEALTEKELKLIENTEFPDISLQKTKDIFLFSSYTALRFGDISNLKSENLRETENGIELHIVMEKVQKVLTIPLSKMFEGKPEKILKKYLEINKDKETIFEVPTNQFVNRNLKVIKTVTGIKKPLTFHISRHTCLTLIGKKTGNPYLIMKIAGHSDIKTSMKYTQGVIDNKLFDLL